MHAVAIVVCDCVWGQYHGGGMSQGGGYHSVRAGLAFCCVCVVPLVTYPFVSASTLISGGECSRAHDSELVLGFSLLSDVIRVPAGG